MDLFSISDLARFSGVKAHTIRIWEKRYNALQPHRTEGNTRYYDNSQLRRLLNIVSLGESGYKVSELCTLPDKKLFTLLKDILDQRAEEPAEYFVSQLISAGISYDESQFDKVLSHCITHYGMKDAYSNVIYPTLMRIGMMWSCDVLPPVQEHYISNLIRQKILAGVDSLPLPHPSSEKWILFLPENEFHEMGLLAAYYLIRLSGGNVIYLGNNVPLPSLLSSLKELKPDNLLFFFVHNEFEINIKEFTDTLAKKYKGRILLAADENLTAGIKFHQGITLLSSVETLVQKISY